MKFITFVRSTLFNFLFYGLTALACIICLPGLFFSEKVHFSIAKNFVKTVYWLERHILGLDYEVRGLEHIPKDQSYIVAAKHQSPYETFKLHILFDQPAVVLKQELLKIPLWGKYLESVKPIAIDRSQGKSAIQQIQDGALKVKEEKRPLVIFPQGTRVYSWQTPKDKPYKIGVAKIHTKTDLPIIPMALNTGLFWPRTSWMKYPGTVVFEFLPALDTTDKTAEAIIKDLETVTEQHTKALETETLNRLSYLQRPQLERPA